MSDESAKRFWARMNADESFRAKVMSPRFDRVAFLAQEGFDFKPEEFARLVRKRVLFGVLAEVDGTRSSNDSKI